ARGPNGPNAEAHDRRSEAPPDSPNGHPAGVTDAPPAGAGDAWEGGQAEPTPTPPAFDFIDSRTFCEKDCRPSWLIPRLLVKGQPAVWGGPQKTLKTSGMIDAGVSMATGA